MKKVLIFGYGGFVGPYLAKEFLGDKYTVVGSDINPSTVLKDVKFVECNILDAVKVKETILEFLPDLIINLAAISSVALSWEEPSKTISINVVGSLNILDAAKFLSNKPKILFVGSSEEYAICDKPIKESNTTDANNPYGISKLFLEKLVKLYKQKYGMKIYCVRSFNHTGVGQKEQFALPSFCKQVAEIVKTGKARKIYVGNLDVKRDFSDVRDIVRAYKMIIESNDDETIYNLGSGKAYLLSELLEYIISLSKLEIKVIRDEKKYRPNDNPIVCCDNTLIKSRLGWKPEFSIKDTLKEMFNYYLNN